MIAEWASSDDGAVTVQAAPGGVPLQVELTPAALGQRPELLARAVLDAAQRAGRRATARLRAELIASGAAEAVRTIDRIGLAAEQPPDEDERGPLLWSPR